MTDSPARPWAAVMGVGAWTPGFPAARAFRAGTPTPDASSPPARLPVRLRRRASLLIRMAAEVAAQASEQAGIALGAIPIVVGSAYGELTTTMEMLHELGMDRALSPFRFHNSVHNTASGYLSIAHENRCPATSVAAGNDTASMVLLEAMTLLAERGGDVLLVLADESVPEALTSPTTSPVAAAMILRARPSDDDAAVLATLDRDALAWLGALRPVYGPTPVTERPVDEHSPGLAFLSLVSAALDAPTPARAEPHRAHGREHARLVDRRRCLVEAAAMTTSDDAGFPDLVEVVPHRPPMLLLDRVCAHSDSVTVCVVAIRDDSPFVVTRDGRREVPAVVGIEYMAQTVAAYAGLAARKERRPPRVGFLLGCRELSLATDGFAVGEVLHVEAQHVFGENDLGSFACKITRDGQTLASGTLTVYQGPLPEDMKP